MATFFHRKSFLNAAERAHLERTAVKNLKECAFDRAVEAYFLAPFMVVVILVTLTCTCPASWAFTAVVCKGTPRV